MTDQVRRIENLGERTPIVRSISQRKKGRPGTITEQAKLSKPVSDWTSRKVTFFLLRKSVIISMHFCTLSKGKRASIRQESSSMPAKESICEGPNVFSGAVGMPR